MAGEDPQKLADALERDTERLARRSEELEQQIEETRQDWRRKRQDESVPGAPPPEGDSSAGQRSPAGADEEPPPEARPADAI